jgi:hypothetical protein
MKFENPIKEGLNNTVTITLTETELKYVHDAIESAMYNNGYRTTIDDDALEVLDAFWKYLHNHYH